MPLRLGCVCLFSLLLACGAPPSVSLSAPATVAVFQDLEVEVPLTLQWEGDPEALSLTASSSTGLSIAPRTIAAGTTQLDVVVVASETATSGELLIQVEGEVASSSFTLPVTVATAALVSASEEPLLRGGRAEAVVSVTGGEPLFDGALSATALADNQWRLTLAVPLSAGVGVQELQVTANVDSVSQTLTVPITVTDAVTVTTVDRMNVPVGNQEVRVNGLATKLTNAEGQATFTGVEAPYRLTVKTRADIAYTFDGATLAAPRTVVSAFAYPEQVAAVDVTLRDRATNQVLNEVSGKWVSVLMDGQTPWGIGFAAGQGTTSGQVRWRSTATSQLTRFRATTTSGGVLTGYGDSNVTVDATLADPQHVSLRIAPPAVGSIQTRFTPPPGFQLEARFLTAIFSGNRWDQVDLPGSDNPNVEFSMVNALDRDDVTHTISVYAQDLAGRTSNRRWTGLKVGELAEGALSPPPQLTPPPAVIGADTVYTAEGESWPSYSYNLTVGEGADRRMELLITPSRSGRRPGTFPLVAPAPATVELCGSSLTVDQRLRGNVDTSVPGAGACDRSWSVTYQ